MTYRVSDLSPSKTKQTGTEVIIGEVVNHPSLLREDTVQEFAQHFAPYLHKYPNVSLFYDGIRIDPTRSIDLQKEYSLPEIELEGGHKTKAHLTVIEWKTQVERSLYLCNAEGFPLERTVPRIQAPHFQFTAYIKSDFLQELDDENALAMVDMHTNLQKFLNPVKDALRNHFRERAAEVSRKLVDGWKKDEVYPYKGAPRDFVEEAERQVFDVLALNVSEYLPGFYEYENKSKKFAFSLLRQSLAENPKALRRILDEVLGLGKEKQEELAELLERTSLSAIINAAKIVADRLDFLAGLETLVFDYKKVLLERKQLHRIVEEQTWIFGEEFHLTLSDRSLTSVLEKHLAKLGRNLNKQHPVQRADGSTGIVDLMLSQTVPQPREDENVHLIVELKRPSQRINSEAAQQVISYANAVASDERFKSTNTAWVFWAVSNEIDEDVQLMAEQFNRPEGLILDNPRKQIRIWVKSWGQIIESCRARLKFFQQKLEYSSDNESALKLLRKIHSKYLPDDMQTQDESSTNV